MASLHSFLSDLRDRRDFGWDLLRIALGLALLARGARYALDPDPLVAWLGDAGLAWGPAAAVGHFTVMAHIGGGLLLAVGLATRAASLANLPVLLGAVFVVHGGAGLGAAGESLELAALTLLLLCLFSAFGAGGLSLDSRLAIGLRRRAAARIAPRTPPPPSPPSLADPEPSLGSSGAGAIARLRSDGQLALPAPHAEAQHVVFALFETAEQGERAVDELRRVGLADEDHVVVHRDHAELPELDGAEHASWKDALDGFLLGGAAGLLLGGIAGGLLPETNFGIGVLPGAALGGLAGASWGAFAGFLAGAAGVDRDFGRLAARLRPGGMLLTVIVRGLEGEARVEELLARWGAVEAHRGLL
jgi:uncharacterized membrane protein YphA (DoxX/SURF4 family)/uncharacterized membrane protein